VLNLGNMASKDNHWDEFDSLPDPPFAAMEEGAFFNPWGKKGEFRFLNEDQWLNQVNTMQRMKHVRMLMHLHGPVASDKEDLSRMDACDAAGNRAWDVLWYGLASFLQGYNDGLRNAYLSFNIWDHRFFWLKEFDPKYLHLGKARGPSGKVAGTEGYVYMREFDDGWVVANPTSKEARGVPVPGGSARVLTHDSFEHPEKVPLVEKFDLAVHRGVILLKPEKKSAGNADIH